VTRLVRMIAAAAVAAALVGPSFALLPAGGAGSARTAAAATTARTGLTMKADARYVVNPAKHLVHVTVGLIATNHLTDTKTHRYFFDHAFLAVQPATANFRIASPGLKPSVGVQAKRSTYTLLRIGFGKQLPAGASRAFALAFDIPDRGGAPTRPIRIGTSLVSFGAWGFGGDGAAGGSVTVLFPPGFTIDVHAAGLGGPTTDPAGNTVYATGPLPDPLTFFASFVADRPNALHETALTVTIDDRSVPIRVRAWPDDPAWAKRIQSILSHGLPELAKQIGLPWTLEPPLVVEEAVSRSASGFAGRWNPQAGQIQIAYYAGTFVVLHEAAHAWFDGRLLADRWASEGFASWYAVQAARAMGAKTVTGDVLTPALEKLRVPLNAWGPPNAVDPAADDAEYAAALKLAGLIAQRAGPDALASVWRSINDRTAAYQPTSDGVDVEMMDSAPDWRGLLDQLEGATGKRFDDLWRAWVVRPTEAGLLADRAAARARFEAIRTRAGSWRLPRVVRDAMRVWQFDQANALLDGAARALDARDEVAAAAAELDLVVPDTMRTAFEGPRGFAAAAAESGAELAAIAAYRDAAASRVTTPDPLERIGLWNADPDGALDQASTAFTAGDLRTMVQDSAVARATWTSARDIGRNRLIAVLASLATVIVGGWLIVRAYRDRSLRRRTLIVGRG